MREAGKLCPKFLAEAGPSWSGWKHTLVTSMQDALFFRAHRQLLQTPGRAMHASSNASPFPVAYALDYAICITPLCLPVPMVLLPMLTQGKQLAAPTLPQRQCLSVHVANSRAHALDKW